MEKNITCQKCGATMIRQGDNYKFECPYCGEQKIVFNKQPEKPTPQPEQEVKYVYIEREAKPDFHSNSDPASYNSKPRKSKSTAVWLCFLLGVFGAHQFYLGKPIKGIAYLISALTGWGLILAFIFCFIDFFILISRDASEF